MTNPKYLSTVDELDNLVVLSPHERKEMEAVCEKFPFRANDYYLSLIDWKDRQDPLRRIVVPDPAELDGGGMLDPSHEKDYTKKPGLSKISHHFTPPCPPTAPRKPQKRPQKPFQSSLLAI